ncbi:MAG: hypothetical protein ACOYM2_16445 [Rectinemataceae bacterium]
MLLGLDKIHGGQGLRVLDRRWLEVCMKATEFSWTRDPFDRMIAAQAFVEGQRLLSRNRMIQKNCSLAFRD